MPRVSLPLLACTILGACRATAPDPAPSGTAPEPSLPRTTSVEGRPLGHFVFEGPSDADDTVLFLATIHGDEAAGTTLLQAFCERVLSDPTLLAGRRAVVVPVVNPDGLARDRRTNARGVDLNRNFSSTNWSARARHGATPLSEPESRYLAYLLEKYRPMRVLSFHQAANLIDYDGPGEALARALAASSPLEVDRMGARPGSLGSYVGEDLGIPIITVELPRSADGLDPDQAWETYGRLVLEALRFEEPDSLPAEDP